LLNRFEYSSESSLNNSVATLGILGAAYFFI